VKKFRLERPHCGIYRIHEIVWANSSAIKSIADNWIVEFVRVLRTVARAVETRIQVSVYDIFHPDVEVHFGGVTIQDDDFYGDEF